MFAALQSLSGVLTTAFVLTSMLNVGLTQDPAKLLERLREWRYLLRMVVANFFVVPGVMLLFVTAAGIGEPYASGLIVFSLAAGAPLLIKLTAASENDIASGASVQMVLMVATILIMPWLLPLVMEGVTVDALAIAQSLIVQMLLPLAVGMAAFQWAQGLAARVQPWIARISNIALYGLLATSLLGFLPQLADPALWAALATGLAALLIAFFVGWGTGQGNEAHAEIGALGTSQRNTAAALIVATTNFSDPRVFVTVLVLNTLGMVVLLFIATRLRGDARLNLFEPLQADHPRPPERG